jgi:hypothetical protein
MRKVKITSNKIEEIFLLMNYFTESELIKFEYCCTEGQFSKHTLYVTFGVITEKRFVSRMKKFNKIHKNLLIFEFLDSSYFLKQEESKLISENYGKH